MFPALILNAGLVAHIAVAIEKSCTMGRPTQWQASVKAGLTHVLIKMDPIAEPDNTDAKPYAIEVDRKTGKWVYSRLAAFDAGTTYRDWQRAERERRRNIKRREG